VLSQFSEQCCGSGFNKGPLDPDPDSLEMPDPDSTNPDSQHWL
jgi:hypothetical protein